jgi:hypothetical protein
MSLEEMVEIGYSLFVLSQVHSHFGVTMNLLIPFYVFSHERWPSSLGPLIPPSLHGRIRKCVWGGVFGKYLVLTWVLRVPKVLDFPSG